MHSICSPSRPHPSLQIPPTNPSPLFTHRQHNNEAHHNNPLPPHRIRRCLASEEDASESTCTREIYRHPLDKYCRSFMMHGRRGGSQGEIMMVNDEDDDSEGAPEQCCNQLRRMKEECRCPAVRHLMREIMQQEGKGSVEECQGGRCGEVMMRGRFLPAMCGMEPRTCRMRQSGNGY